MQSTEIEGFISRVVALPPGPGVSLDAALQPSLDDEVELRKLFATDRQNARLSNPHVGLVDVFAAPDAIRTTRARVVEGKDDLSAHYVMPLSDEDRREEGTPAMVADLEEFRKNWAIFTEGSLSQLIDWSNVVAAGGSVLACMAPLDEKDKISKRATRKYYHTNAYPTSDVDLFLWGMTPEQAETKIKVIYEAVRDSVPWDVTCIRTKHTVSIHSQYPYRSVQIVLRLYQSPAEILAGFDIDAPCCAYDGERVWANPRAIVAMMRQCNTSDVTRRSPSYEIRLAKYSRRAYEVYVPDLKRGEIDPTIFERAISRMEGLARLLILEKLADDGMRTAFLQSRRNLRGRPHTNSNYRRNKRRYKGDLKEETGMGIEMNDYDVASLHIPYGPGWDARRIDKLVYQTDLGMNSTFNPKNKGRRLHRHAAFFGTIEECLEDCCEHCPAPIDDDEKKLQEEENELYVNGRIKFIEENPGRQSMTGSFNPIDVGEWSEQAYLKTTQQFFAAIASRDRATVQKLLKEEIDVNQRDYVGRTTLHVAIAAKATDITLDLIDAGARITARLADGRAPLHLAAQYDEPIIIQKLFERSAKNAAEQKKKEEEEEDMKMVDTDRVRPSSEDDWSSHDDEDVVMAEGDDERDDEDEDEEENDGGDDSDDESGSDEGDADKPAAQDAGEIPEEDDQPDIIEVDALDWDLGFSAVAYAVCHSSLATLNALIERGADPVVPSKPRDDSDSLHPLTLTLLRQDEDEACKIAERLLQLPSVTSSTADEEMRTIFHRAVAVGRTKIVETILRCDPHAITVLDFPAMYHQNVIFPVVTAIGKRNLGVLGLLLAYGAKLELQEQDVTKALDAASEEKRRGVSYTPVKNYLELAFQPVEVAVNLGDDIANLLIALGATIDIGTKHALGRYTSESERRSLKDWFDFAVNNVTVCIERSIGEAEEKALRESTQEPQDDEMETDQTGWRAFHSKFVRDLQASKNETRLQQDRAKAQSVHVQKQMLERLNDTKEFLVELRDTLIEHKAKTWKEIYPALTTEASLAFTILPYLPPRQKPTTVTPEVKTKEKDYSYAYLATSSYDRRYVPEHSVEKYDELYEACYAGNNDKIQRLCLPTEGQNATIGQGIPSPLNISVRQIDSSISNWDQSGYTPLFAAICGRRWSTAKLILAIATAQYSPENKVDKVKFTIDVDLDEDSDPDSDGYDSDASDVTVARQEIKFVDIATRPSTVKSQTHPKVMLQETKVNWVKPESDKEHGPKCGHDNLLGYSVAHHDLEAFVQIMNLYNSLSQPLDIRTSYVLNSILAHDQADILDEYIRRTGDGIDIVEVAKSGENGEESEIHVATNDDNKIYLGLNVHGKKRMDLAKKNDPNATSYHEPVEHPLVWRAASSSAKAILEYLASDKPLAAYQFYTSSHSDAKAIWFKRMLGGKGKSTGGVLEKKLPLWLGWFINSIGESPLTAAMISNSVTTIKLLAKLQPGLIAQALQARIKFAGANMINLAIAKGCDAKIIDYLLSRKVSATERLTNQGWNIYHQICSSNNVDQLEHLLRKLPKDINDVLLTQQSKVRLNTPLHIAANGGYIRLVEVLLKHAPSAVLMLNIDGQTPLHNAVEQSYAKITKALLDAAPAEVMYIENCVGRTPSEIAELREFGARLSSFKNKSACNNVNSNLKAASHSLASQPFEVFLQNENLVKEMVEALKASGGKYKSKVISAVEKWSAQRGKKLKHLEERRNLLAMRDAEFKKTWDTPTRDPKNPKDHADDKGTLAYIQEAASAAKLKGVVPPRRLIHLFEVQQSIAATISSVRGEDNKDGVEEVDYYHRGRKDDEGELEEEESDEKKERRQSMVLMYLPTGVETN